MVSKFIGLIMQQGRQLQGAGLGGVMKGIAEIARGGAGLNFEAEKPEGISVLRFRAFWILNLIVSFRVPAGAD